MSAVLENQMVIGATAEYERRNVEIGKRERSDMVMDALCDGYWDDYLPTKDLREQAEYLCLAVDLKQDDAAIARLARHFVEMAKEHGEAVL